MSRDGRKTGGGSRKGVPNKATQNAREAIARFVDGSADEALLWLKEVYEQEGPLAAFRCWLDLIEYHVPKLQRTDINAELGPKATRLLEIVFPGRQKPDL